MTRRNIIKPLVGVLLSACVAVFAMLCAMGVFGWFSMSRDVTGNGMGVQTKAFGVLDIRKIDNGEDIGVDVATKDMEKLEKVMQSEKFIPSAYGQFTFYVHDGSTDERQSFSFTYSISVKNNEFYPDADYPQGLYPGVDTTKDDFKKAEQYINSHIMFFTAKDNGVYSGWLNPDEPTKVEVSEHPGAYEVTVYWVWVEQFDHIFTENDGLIEEETRQKIVAYYGKKENIEKLLVDGKNRSAESYNIADTIIGMTYKYICFEINVTKN